MAPFFLEHSSQFSLEPSSDQGFRQCQLGAVWAIKSHFTRSHSPGLISMPTGSGKTALMMALAFELKARRVLVVTPSKVIRDQIAREFATMDILEKIGAIPATFGERPDVKANKKVCSSIDKWSDLLSAYDVVVATPKTISPIEKDVVPPPEDSFDVVFFDEAHHAPANTWNALIDAFANAKVLLLTATPFRRDKKRIKASMVYHYSIVNAMRDDIYRAVEYVAVNTSLNSGSRDELLAHAAQSKFLQESAVNGDVKMLIKTSTVDHAEKILRIYRGLGLNIDTVHSRKTDKQNNDVIEQCRSGVIDGVICVGMVGEGLDIPQLKLAVLHEVPRTLPFTIQFIGRISRVNNTQTGSAYLIADPDHVKGEVRKLYRFDRGWAELIPNLVDRRVSQAGFLRDHDSIVLNPYDIDTTVIEPFFSVRIYSVNQDFEFRDNFFKKLPADLEVILIEQENESEPLILLTSTAEHLPWGKGLPLSHTRFDLHIFLLKGEFLFEYTTSDFYCNTLKKALLDDESYSRVNYDIIKKGLSDASGKDYCMIGMSNSSGVSRSNPRYKMYLGKEVQTALRIGDGRIFSAGHALARISEEETRGIALQNSRVWSICRDNLQRFKEWCISIYDLISSAESSSSIPQMEYLADAQSIDSLPGEPITILFDDILFNSSAVTIEVDGTSHRNPNSYFGSVAYDTSNRTISATLHISEETSVNVRYELSDGIFWTNASEKDVRVIIDFGTNEPFKGTLDDYMIEYPPLIILSTGQTVRGNQLFTPKVQSEQFNRDLFISKDWTGTDLKREAKQPRSGYQFNVQEKTIEHIRPSLDSIDLLIVDDRAHEVADLICIRPGTKVIEFYHCKYKVSDGLTPGAAKSDFTELTEQGIRNGHWIYNARLISRLIERTSGNSNVIHGTHQALQQIGRNFYPNQWSYKIVLVQPGIKKERVFRASPSNIERLLCTLYDRTVGIDSSFEVWGS